VTDGGDGGDDDLRLFSSLVTFKPNTSSRLHVQSYLFYARRHIDGQDCTRTRRHWFFMVIMKSWATSLLLYLVDGLNPYIDLMAIY